ncbi:MAG: type II toxin-antitoxin system Phd/YefM family antitoxin [Blastocatellia bacterium]|nr:type II toxin-antitoxin system Phd/YefM family antitoxin [Blastocatellia bacterium]
MLDLERDIHPLSDFKRNTPKYLEQLRETGDPILLTINGRAALVVMDAESYQEILDRLAYAEELAAIRKGIDEFDRGEGRPARKALEELRRKHGISR